MKQILNQSNAAIKNFELLKSVYKSLSSKELRERINGLINQFGFKADNGVVLNESNSFQEAYDYHLYLIQLNNAIIEGKSSSINKRLLNEHCNSELILKTAIHGDYTDQIVTLNAPSHYFIIGDIHSDIESLINILEATHFYDNCFEHHWIFMGDYVDRGMAHLKTTELLLVIANLFSDHVTLLRGNHDGGKLDHEGQLKLPYRIPDQDNPLDYFPPYLLELEKKMLRDERKLLCSYLDWFDKLPYLGLIKTNIGNFLCVHGGLPKPYFGQIDVVDFLEKTNVEDAYDYLHSFSDLTQYKALDNGGATIVEQLIWSDPQRGDEEIKFLNKRFKFRASSTDAFLRKFNLKGLFRGHEVFVMGIEKFHADQVISVFSSGSTETTAYGHVQPALIRLATTGEVETIKIKNV